MAIPFVLAELVLLALLVAVPALLVLALVDLVRHPRSTWDAADQSQLIWALIVVFVGVIGPVLYLLIARPRLRAAAHRAHHPRTEDTVELRREALNA